ncbi:MAG: hypothetical protein ACFCVD_08770 [Nodosilinea sp.]
MTQPSSSANSASDAALAAERDLLASLLAPDRAYPWEPLSPEGDDYFFAAEAELDIAEVEDAIAAGWNTFSTQIEARWGQLEITTAAPLFTKLNTQFQERIPAALLRSIAVAATDLARSGRPLVDQLVDCVNAALPTWDPGDLAVLARPLAFSLRDGRSEILDLSLRSMPQPDWEALSSIEQARLSLAIASVALKEAEQNE